MRYLITGGCGFVGANLADSLLTDGSEVVVLDNLARGGVRLNRAWLVERHGARVRFLEGDVRDARAVREAVGGCHAVAHLAAQVAVTTSVADPRTDFEVNALGTLNVLEAVREQPFPERTTVLFTSTNKVYGSLDDLNVSVRGDRYAFENRASGIDESRPLDFHSPYGCSKGSADQYVRDYARIYGIPTIIFRMSCIYGPRQFGTEDQAWVAHFMMCAARGRPVTIYGDGKQARDLLFVSDLVGAMRAALADSDRLRGHVFNIGGGPENVLSVLELVAWIRRHARQGFDVRFGPRRPGDQRIYVSDIARARGALDWSPRVSVEDGLARLWAWIGDCAAATCGKDPPG